MFEQDRQSVQSQEFDKLLEKKFGSQYAKDISQAANARLSRTNGGVSQIMNDQSKTTVTMANYNSYETPENNFEVKRVLNSVNELKRVNFQRYRYSSFDLTSKD